MAFCYGINRKLTWAQTVLFETGCSYHLGFTVPTREKSHHLGEAEGEGANIDFTALLKSSPTGYTHKLEGSQKFSLAA